MNVLLELLPGFGLNLVVAFVIIRIIYYQSSGSRHDYIFTFFSVNILIYFVSDLLRDVQLSVGFGLLAIFSTLRFRTWPIPVKEMSYLFICVSLPFMNTLFLATRISYAELIILNTVIVIIIYILEQQWGVRFEFKKKVLYEKIELIKPENYHLLLADLRERTGLKITRCEITRINLLQDTAQLLVYYDEEPGMPVPIDDLDNPYGLIEDDDDYF
ncbi:MAG: DUF4956 domain-containing protein [Chloroflexota bacterium]